MSDQNAQGTNPFEEVAAAEMELAAAQARLDAARQRAECAARYPEAAQQTPPAGQQPGAGQQQVGAAQQPGVAQSNSAGQQPGATQADASQQPRATQPNAAQQQIAAQFPGTAQQSTPQQPGPATQQPLGQSTYTAPAYASTSGAKDHVAAGLLGIFLGFLGVHKFYLGYNTAGFIMLAVTVIGGILTMSVAACAIWVIGIVEGIIYLAKSQSEFEQMYIVNKREWF